MSIHASLHHVTEYEYDRPVNLGPQVIRLRPAPHCRSHILSYSLKIEPADHFINWQQDPFANYQARLVFPEKTTRFKVTVDLVTEMAVYNPFDFFLEPDAEEYPFTYSKDLKKELRPYLGRMRNATLNKYLKSVDRSPRRTIDFLVALNQKVHTDINYLIRMEPGVQTPDETLDLGSGSCRDSAWLMVNILRLCGLASRFVSGYLIQLKPDVKSLDGPSGTEVDFTDLHAWCEVYLPGAGWIGLDPTSGLFAGEGHIPVACTPEPSGAAPIEGGVDECEVQFKHTMEVTRIYESPRVTKPYTEDQWQAIVDLGHKVDQKLIAGDVRLTMGGEPTFVSVNGRDEREWNIDALGPTKRAYATELVEKLRKEYGDGGFLHYGQGKWYPGEQLPRWALSIYWRADGQPIWKNPKLFADERDPIKYTSKDAEKFVRTLSKNLGLVDKFIEPAYEDIFYYLWRESKLPVNVDPFKSNLDDEMERTRLKRVFTQKLDSVIGYVLPIEADAGRNYFDTQWKTGAWLYREDRLYLLPGDSPMGYRLPLDSLPWTNKADYPYLIEQDPFAPRPPLPTSAPVVLQQPPSLNSPTGTQGKSTSHSGKTIWSQSQEVRHPQRQESAAWITRTALCVETRDPMRSNGPAAENDHGGKSGVLYVFMPPLSRLEDYLNLLNAVEATAEELQFQIVIEGYTPPRDPRIKLLQVTPDPGVIEVNIHPAHNWNELVSHTEFLYQAAFESRLSAEKFMTDGRHTGTGGGNHFVMGGATPIDSPFLRKPELLASLILYWHNHPSLSYLFSGMFIGPTSQAPRVDEARNDQLYELEIALKEIHENRKKYGQSMPPWMVDRTLRNILIDVTGNTHRSEFCIDKMYSPDSQTGRLGLLELRAFEMPPHAHMSIVQQLLIRGLIARFWDEPYLVPATRWGTELHDRCLLPTFIKMDFDDVIKEMQIHGYDFKAEWFAPHLEFRFPLIGQVQTMGTEITLRMGLEPWHVMGEENAVGGTARYVDSSLERIEVRVTGLNQSRYTITCNGEPLPLQSTGTAGEYVAGVRYKAWNPPSSLHPSIGVHAPLVFDVIDTWMKRSIGGCQYHVAHPGGLNYGTFPINAYEAESRRLSRFFRMGHTPGKIDGIQANIDLQGSKEFPFTLDMRR
ncbi:DUF2126 domain-containing protein [Polynucleobacter sp. AP-Latsch-80-C2]|jgi:uncharacterized protein (DUF2126 family)/transglutaminase-like putative cysteine protease|uniref:transglutaminase family protein n=1 Tax=Polynucleobacter sp. AP-Latsch-80-C2 TaxID=2576931 RepID=UPI001C0CE740|nr:transglutaminase family protein [Polynucleobacter sp. AP-Latsch-80-C2]MBU3624348.1 transglutaminase family protein [Polynucleobacter sp. AP-Latsch-80-C2]